MAKAFVGASTASPNRYNMENKNKNIVVKVLAWLGLIIIAVFILALVYALFTKNGQLAFAMTFAIIFISILFWIGIRAYKGLMEYSKKQLEEKEREDFINIANTKTKKK